MSSASYAAWAKFDVETELERVDEREKRDLQHKQQQRQVQAKEGVESSATQAAQQSANVLAAQAAVAALKAKKRVRKGKDKNSAVEADEDAEKAAKLQTQAALFAQKHELLQQIMENRRLEDRIVRGGKDWKEAKKLLEKALEAVKKLEQMAPELLKAEEDQAQLLGKESRGKGHEHGDHCENDGEECGKSCSHNHKVKKKVVAAEPLPKANDLVAIIRMFYKDVYMGIGTCDLEERRLAAATEAFKEVLLRGEVHLAAWFKRGEAFEQMDAPLLAMLHYSRITNLDSDHEGAKEALERVKTKLLIEGDACGDTVQSAVSSCTEGRTFKEVLERIEWVFEEANVLAAENFYDYSTTKYQVVLGCLETLRARPEFCAAIEASALSEIEISCHLNIASGCLEMQRNFMKALSHCEQALRLDSNRAISHFRMGQLNHALHNYEMALECFETAKALVPAIATGQLEEQRKKVLATIAKETDKCEFDRNQYDVGYLRSLAAK